MPPTRLLPVSPARPGPGARFLNALTVSALLPAALGLAVLLGSGCERKPAQGAAQVPHTPIPKADATLTIANDGSEVRYQGTVADEATRDALTGTLATVYGREGVGGALTVDPNIATPPWAGNLGPFLAGMTQRGATVRFQGKRIELGGTMEYEQRATLKARAQRLYPGYALTGLFEGVHERDALPEPGDTAGLVAYLNRIYIDFESDSGMVTSASQDGLSRAARAIRHAGKDTRLLAGVHPARGGMAASEREIASQRADAIGLQLAIRGVDPGIVQARVVADGPPEKAGKVEFSVPAAPSAPEAAATGAEPAEPESTASAETP